MPNRNTFVIKPIRETVEYYVGNCSKIVDPFANNCKIANITNDLNPEYKTDYNLDALSFLKMFKSKSVDMVLFDPPYSITQAAVCYKSYGKEKLNISVSNMKYWSDCKNEIQRILLPGGYVITCGWNSNGCGISRGFELIELLIVPHGGSKNDTIVTVEKKNK